MKKVRNEAIPDPEQQAVEERVRQLMDPSVSDDATSPAAVSKAGGKTISVVAIPDAAESAATNEPPKKAASKATKIIIAHDESEAEPAAADAVVTPDKDSIIETPPQPIPKATKSKKAKSVAVIIAEDPADESPLYEPAAESTAPLLPDSVLEAVNQPTNSTEDSAPEPAELPPATEVPAPIPDTQPASQTAPLLQPRKSAAVTKPKVKPAAINDVQKPAAMPSNDPLFTPEPLPPATKLADLPPVIEDIETSRAVEDIIVTESDALLRAQDEAIEDEKFEVEAAARSRHRIGFAFVFKALLLLLLIAVVGIVIVPQARYYALNHVGVRSSASVTVLDQSTQQPLKAVTVVLGGQSVQTGADGKAILKNLRLGPTTLKIQRRAFATVSQAQTIGWGSNPLGDIKLTPTGQQYGFMVVDYVSGLPVSGVQAATNDANAVSDDKGVITLTTDQKDLKSIMVSLNAAGYRTEQLLAATDTKSGPTIKLVSNRKEVFVSKRANRLDIFRADLDGKNESRLLAGTGSERDDIVLVPHPSVELAALVSTRDNKRNNDGFLLSSLTILNLADGTSKIISTSERLEVVDWVGDRLIYLEIAQGESAASTKRHRLMSYDSKTQSSRELATSNFFNDVVVIKDKIYYAPSTAYQSAETAGLYRIDPDGINQQRLLDKEVWNIFRNQYDQLQLATPDEWYGLTIGGSPTKLPSAPANPQTRVYITSPDGKHSLWIETKDGKPALMLYDVATKKESSLTTEAGLSYPLRWIDNNTYIYRISNAQQTADYARSVSGGDAKKIHDVSNSGGVEKWYVD